MSTYSFINSYTVTASGGVANFTFSSIPQTYTDLLLKVSARSLRAGAYEDGLGIAPNGSNATSWTLATGNGSATSSGTSSSLGYGLSWAGRVPGDATPSATFGNLDLYIPNYTSSSIKTGSVEGVSEINGTYGYQSLVATLYPSTAITSLLIVGGNANLAQNSTFYLYGITKA